MATAIKNRKETVTTMRWGDESLAILDTAAALRGISRSELVRSAALREAEDIVQRHNRTQLSLEESQAFLRALEAPAKRNPALAKLFKKAADVERRQ